MLSVLIVNWNTCDRLNACLQSIQRYPGLEPLEVLVVDNDSHDGSADMVRSQHPWVRLIEPKSNTGYARGNNLAYAASSGAFILTLNPDTEVFEDTLDRAVQSLRDRPEVGALGARQIGPDGATQRSVRGFPSLMGILGDASGLAKTFPRTRLGGYRLPAFDYELAQPAPQPMGTFLLFRREAIESVAGKEPPFDEQFPIFFNEVDLLYRMAKAGWPCVYDPRVQILHHGGEGTKQVRKHMIWESHRSLVRYFEKHHPSPFLPLLKRLILFGAWVRARGVYAGFRP